MTVYDLVPVEQVDNDVTHEIEVSWTAEEPHPPVLPAATVIDLEDRGSWYVVVTHYWPQFDENRRPAISYLVRRD